MSTLILAATLLLCAMNPAWAAEPRQQKPASGLLESLDNQRLLTIDKDQSNREAADEELEFTKRFNNLIRALRDFSNSYNVGHVINAKQAKGCGRPCGTSRNRNGSIPQPQSERVPGPPRFGEGKGTTIAKSSNAG